MKQKNFEKEVSVIIRSKNEEQWIGYVIQSVIDKIGLCQIIIIDNNSSDETITIAKSFIQSPKISSDKNKNYTNIKIIKIHDYTPGLALNICANKINTKYTLIISAHCVLTKINLKKSINDLKRFVAIFGNQIPIFKGKKITKRYIWSHFKDFPVENMYSDLENRYFFHNAIAFYKTKTLKKNPFDIALSGKEDRYWINNQVKKKKFLYDPSLEVEHHFTQHGNTWKGMA